MNTNKIFFFISICFSLSCSQKNEFFFEPERKAINLWLGNSTVVDDSLTYNFAYTVTGRDSVMFNYRLSGYPLEHDTEFELQAVAGDTDLVHFSFGKYIIKAGQFEGRFPIYIDKPAGYDEFRNSTGRIVFKMKPSDQFGEAAKELSGLTIQFRNYVAKPDNWDAATYPYFTLARYFGAYSDVKYGFIIQTTGMANFKVYYTVVKDPVLEENTITSVQATYLQTLCKAALQAYKAENGPLLDENNNEVVFP